MRLAIQMTSKCDFKCDHCMFSCTSRGRHMSDDLINTVGRFIRMNDIGELSLYGGEPFLDVDHFDKCFREWYTNDMSLFVSSNGSFVTSKKRYKYFTDVFLKKAKYNSYRDMGVQVRISHDEFHKEFWTPVMERKIKQMCRTATEPFMFWDDMYSSDDDDYDYYVENPYDYESSQSYPFVYLDSMIKGYDWVNPVGRAAEFGVWSKNNDCHCIITSDSLDVDDEYEHNGDVVIASNGDVKFCCRADSGSVGKITEFETMEAIIEAITEFRKQIRIKHDIGSNAKMLDTCAKCVKFKMKVGVKCGY